MTQEVDEIDESLLSNDEKSISYKDIVMIQYKKISSLLNTEFRGGFYQKTTSDSGEKKVVYVEDTREVFNNAVICLVLLLIPRFKDEMKKAYEDFKIKKKKMEQEFIDQTTIKEEVVLGEDYYKDMKDKLLLETLKIKKLKLHQLLFKDLSIFLNEINHLGFTGGTYR